MGSVMTLRQKNNKNSRFTDRNQSSFEDQTFENSIGQEYREAVKKGFQGTKEEYLAIRDYT